MYKKVKYTAIFTTFLVSSFLNLLLLFITGRVLGFLNSLIYGNAVNTFFDILFFVILIFFNFYLFRSSLFRSVKRLLAKLNRQKEYLKGTAYYAFVISLFLLVVLYRILNTGFTVGQRTNHLKLMIASLAGSKNPEINEYGKNESSLQNSKRESANILNTNIYSENGRFLRTYRWNDVIRKAEKKYEIEPFLVAGLIMQESMGNPLQLNSSNDGGAGLMMFQPGTARDIGLRVWGDSKKTGADKVHGRKLRAKCEGLDYDYQKLAVLDERFAVEKSIYAGAKYLKRLYDAHGSWDKAISAYNRGTPAFFPSATNHVRMVRYFQHYYRSNSARDN